MEAFIESTVIYEPLVAKVWPPLAVSNIILT